MPKVYRDKRKSKNQKLEMKRRMESTEEKEENMRKKHWMVVTKYKYTYTLLNDSGDLTGAQSSFPLSPY